MSNQNNQNRNINRNLVLEDKKDNINLISMEKSPNAMNNINLNQGNNNLKINYNINNNNNIKNNSISNDLLNSRNDEELNLSNINIEKTQKFIQNADFLFPDEESISQYNNLKNSKNSNINLSNSNEPDFSKDGISINDEKRIEFANNLFGNSLSSSIKSNLSNDLSQSLVTEKRKEAADELFQSISDTSSKKRSLNETFKSNKSNMSHAVNNLSGSNLGLNINEIANKYAERDKIINENEEETSMVNNDNNNNNENNIENTKNNDINSEYDKNINEDNDEEISFRKNLIDFKFKINNDLNKSNNLMNISVKKDNNLIKDVKKNDLVSNSKEINSNIRDSENKSNILINNKENNENNENNIIVNNSNSEINLSNIDFGNLPQYGNNNKDRKSKIIDDKKNIIDESINLPKEKNEEILNNKNYKKPNFVELFKKNKNKIKKNEDRKINIIDKDDSEDEASNDILNKNIRLNSNENNESSILNNNKIHSRISIDDDNNPNNKKKLIINNLKSKKIELIKERGQSLDNREEKETNEKLINNSNSKNLISEKNILSHGGRGSLLSENEQNKFIKLKKKSKDESEFEHKNEEDKKEIQKSSKKKINIRINGNQLLSSKEKKLVIFNNIGLNKEKKFNEFLKENNLYYNENIYNEEENDNQLKEIKKNSYFENYIIKQESIYDFINNENKKTNKEILFYFEIVNKEYEKNKNKFNSLFQFITNNDKEKFFKLYKNFQNYNIVNYFISPHINDVNNFNNCFNIENSNNNIDYIRYTIDENFGDTFYRCFMFNLFEKYILNQKKDSINLVIFDIFKLYDLSPEIFTKNKNNNINNTLIFFSILNDYIQLNLWEKSYDLFLSLFSQIDQVLITYIRYNIFLFLSKIFKDYNDINSIYLNQYKKIIINYNEPTRIIFQLIPFIFGINLEIIYYENKNKDDFRKKNLSFTCPKLLVKNNVDTIYIVYYNNCYHIGYQKKDFENNIKIFKSIKDYINIKSPIQYKKNEEIFCDICNKNTECIEIINDNNKGICSECLSSEIDEYLNKRISYIKEDYKSNYINYSYYLRPIELHLKEPISIKDKIENNSIIVKNIDYFLIYKKTFTQRISELFSLSKESSSRNIKQKNSIVKNENNSINNLSNFSNVDINNDEICLKCNKKNNVLSSECGCKFCEDCLYEILKNITNDQIILNGYEKLQSSMEDTNKCPLCKKSLNLDYLVMLLKNKGRNFEIEYNEAKIRMKNYCKTLCFGCEKKITNEKSLEVSHNSKREMLQVNVMINKHCFKDSKKIKNIDFEEENGIDYTDSPHIVCFGCYKKNKNAKTKSIDEVEYKVITCNICGIRHYVSMKDWDKWHKSDVCCKCNIF